ncbi:MAG: pyrroline-5-carboxylate reductase [Clostridiales Family XIII bacterium]|jgi:pyrroline-5-carboxylate reductase|nr:pyrroline-5-carboxylate reductase [Clostridiales Family XIII bacterium]
MRLGFIGAGNMGGAIIRGYITLGGGAPADITAYDADSGKLGELAARLGIGKADSIGGLVDVCDTVILAVKPGNFEEVLPLVAERLRPDQIVVSMAAGVSIGFIEGYLGASAKIVRIMPNTPAMVGESMTAVSKNKNVAAEEAAGVMALLGSIGRAEAVDESLMDAVTGLSGSSPAYVYMFIDALAKGAARNGMDEGQARVFAAQAALGAARMVMETGTDPVTLRENVCSPGGTTIEAVKALQGRGFEETVMEAMQAAVEKSKALTK